MNTATITLGQRWILWLFMEAIIVAVGQVDAVGAPGENSCLSPGGLRPLVGSDHLIFSGDWVAETATRTPIE